MSDAATYEDGSPKFECWECGCYLSTQKEFYADPKRPPLDEDDCLCKDCCIGHLDEVIEETTSELERLNIMKTALEATDE